MSNNNCHRIALLSQKIVCEVSDYEPQQLIADNVLMAPSGVNLNERARIAGTTVRLRYVETSLGSGAIDRLMGGGIPLGGVYLVDEHNSRTYASALTKYFLAEGVYHRHSLFVASCSRNATDLISKLPEKVEEKVEESSPDAMDEPMKIAWRYASQPKMNSSISGRRNNSQFDLQKTLNKSLIDACELYNYPSRCQSNAHPPSYAELWKQIKEVLSSQKYRPFNKSSSSTGAPPCENNLLRIVIEGFGSPLWMDSHMEIGFIARLKAALNDCYAVVMLTFDSTAFDPQRRERIYSYCDAGFLLETVEEGKASSFGDHFDGYLRILKLPSMASIGCHCPESSDLTFELHRKRFDVKILHLPPAMGDVEQDAVQSALPCNGMDQF